MIVYSQVQHISDPVVRQQRPVSTISGISDSNGVNAEGGVKITEVKDTNEMGTQFEGRDEKGVYF